MTYKASLRKGNDVIAIFDNWLDSLNRKIGALRYDGYDLVSVWNVKNNNRIY